MCRPRLSSKRALIARRAVIACLLVFVATTAGAQVGTVTIKLLLEPPDGTDVMFNGYSGDFFLDHSDPDDGDSFSDTWTHTMVSPGYSTFTEYVPSCWGVTGIVCETDDPFDTTVTVDNWATLDVDANEHITCTFINTKPPGYVPGAFPVSAVAGVAAMNPKTAFNTLRQEYLVVWWNDRAGNDDIYAQRVSKNGDLIGPWFAVAFGSGHERRYPAVAYNSARDEYLVVWEDGDMIGGRFVSGAGVPDGTDTVIAYSTSPPEPLNVPRIAYASTSDAYAVVYLSCHSGGGICSIQAAEVAGDQTPTSYGDLVSISSSEIFPIVPDLAYNRTRNELLVVWTQNGGSGDESIFARRSTMTGGLTQLGSPFSVLSSGFEDAQPSVAAIPKPIGNGQYLVVGERWVSGVGRIVGQFVTGLGVLDGAVIDVASAPGPSRRQPSVAGNEASETYQVVWEATCGGVYSQRVLMTGTKHGGVRVTGGSSAGDAEVVSGTPGDFLTVFGAPPWGYGPAGVQGQLDPLIFRDGFDIGSTGTWSSEVSF